MAMKGAVVAVGNFDHCAREVCAGWLSQQQYPAHQCSYNICPATTSFVSQKSHCIGHGWTLLGVKCGGIIIVPTANWRQANE